MKIMTFLNAFLEDKFKNKLFINNYRYKYIINMNKKNKNNTNFFIKKI